MHVDAEGFYDRLVTLISFRGATRLDEPPTYNTVGDLIQVVFSTGRCAGLINAQGLSYDAVQTLVASAGCSNERISLDLPFEPTGVYRTNGPLPTTVSTAFSAVYRRDDGARLVIYSAPVDAGEQIGALATAIANPHRRSRLGYGDVRSVSLRDACPASHTTIAWRTVGNRTVWLAGSVDEPTAVAILAGVRPVDTRTWRGRTSGVLMMDAIQARADPCGASNA